MLIGAIGAGEGCSEAGKLSEYLQLPAMRVSIDIQISLCEASIEGNIGLTPSSTEWQFATGAIIISIQSKSL